MAFPTGWAYQQKLTIQAAQVAATLTDFPVLITRSELHNDIVDPSGSNNAQANGGDIRFSSDAAGVTQLACEIVAFDHDSTTSAGDAVIEIYVIVASISSSVDTDIYIWYDTSGADSQPATSATYGRDAVWDSDFHSVYHMSDASGSLVDSTGNGNSGTVNGTPTRTVTGPFGEGGLDFDGIDDYVSQAAFGAVETGWSIEVWASTDSLAQFQMVYASDASGWNDDILLGIEPEGTTINTADRWACNHQDSTSSVRTTVTDTLNATTAAWYSLAVTCDASNERLYIDGSNTDTTAKAGANLDHGTQAVNIGRDPDDAGRIFNGQMDEYRKSIITRSSDWLTACYNNQNSPSTFVVDSTPVAVGAFQAAWARVAQQCKILGAR